MASAAKMVNDSKAVRRQFQERRDCAMEQDCGLYLSPYKYGRGLYLSSYKRVQGVSTKKKKRQRDDKNAVRLLLMQLDELAKCIRVSYNLEVFSYVTRY